MAIETELGVAVNDKRMTRFIRLTKSVCNLKCPKTVFFLQVL